MQLVDIATASAEVAAIRARLGKIARLAALVKAADAEEVASCVAWLSGELLQRRIGVGWASVADVPGAAAAPALAVLEVERAFEHMAQLSGPGSNLARAAALADLFSRSTAIEQTFLQRLVAGGLRQGALAGVMVDAIASALSIPVADLRRAAMLSGDLPSVARAAKEGGAAALHAVRLQVGRAVAPMLAQTAESVEDILQRIEGAVAFEAKLDGARIQVHKDGEEVRLFTRSLDDITARLPDVVEAVRTWPARTLVADGEIMGIFDDARPMPFQDTASRVAQKTTSTGLRVFMFDLLHLDGEDLLHRPGSERAAALVRAIPEHAHIQRIETRDPEAARAFSDRMLRAGFEGVVAKSLAAPYEAGRRGAGWLKLKPVYTLDLVVLGVEHGSGRRTGKLSNIHLGARDPETGGFVMLGKTFKGMTDAMLDWQTRRFTELAVGPTDRRVVKLRPEQVVEIAFDGVQRSTRYPGGVALRFARVVRYRDDKRADEADTIERVRGFR